MFYEILDELTELRKATVSFVVSVRPHIRMEQRGFFLLLGLDP